MNEEDEKQFNPSDMGIDYSYSPHLKEQIKKRARAKQNIEIMALHYNRGVELIIEFIKANYARERYAEKTYCVATGILETTINLFNDILENDEEVVDTIVKKLEAKFDIEIKASKKEQVDD